jgi:hypothetical protein
MKRKVLGYLICAGFISACGKYKHQELSNPESCELCAHALTLEGTFRGQVYIQEFGTGTITNDSATMTVQQVFLNNSTFDDSTTMYFATTYVHDNSSNVVVYDTVNIHDYKGTIVNSGPEKYWMRNDSIFHQRSLGVSNPGYTVMFEGLFIRI